MHTTPFVSQSKLNLIDDSGESEKPILLLNEAAAIQSQYQDHKDESLDEFHIDEEQSYQNPNETIEQSIDA